MNRFYRLVYLPLLVRAKETMGLNDLVDKVTISGEGDTFIIFPF